MKKRRYLFIAGPLHSIGNPQVNVHRAVLAADIASTRGWTPFIPHLNVLWNMITPHTEEYYIEWDKAWLAKCDDLLRLPGPSVGADNEVKEMLLQGGNVFRGLENLPYVDLEGRIMMEDM